MCYDNEHYPMFQCMGEKVLEREAFPLLLPPFSYITKSRYPEPHYRVQPGDLSK